MFLKAGLGFLLLGSLLTGYLLVDYFHLLNIRDQFFVLQKENRLLKGEAQILVQNIEKVKKSLDRVNDYTHKLETLVSLKVNKVKIRTGIGPLTDEEYNAVQAVKEQQENQDLAHTIMPLGIDVSKLAFRPAFEKLNAVENISNRQALELQQLLSSLSSQKSLLSSIPTAMPVKGWIASNFGSRVSPFTGKLTSHRGTDIAAPPGARVDAPADGVVIFSGAKEGFGNFIMIAHYETGIVTKYGHNAENLVYVGQKVRRGDQIASVGNTGRTTGPHLHYEVWVDGEAKDPRKFMVDADLELF